MANSEENNQQAGKENKTGDGNIILDSILQKKGDGKGDIFLDSTLEGKILEERMKARSGIGWKILEIAIILAIVVFGYFYAVLNLQSDFIASFLGDIYPVQLQKTQDNVVKTQTKINEKNLMIAKFYLDKFVYGMDAFVYKQNQSAAKYSAATDKFNAETQSLKKELQGFLSIAKEKLSINLWPPEATKWKKNANELAVMFKNDIINDIQQKKIELAQGSEKTSEEAREEIKKLDNILSILNSPELKQTFLNIKDVNNLSNDDLKRILTVINKVAKNDFSIISQIKNDRANWSKIIKDIEEVTTTVDPLFGHPELGLDRIRYSSYSFNVKDNKVTLSGTTYMDDGKNFTLIANLIDAFESSPKFKNVSLPNFNKSEASEDAPSTSPLSLDFNLQGENEKDPRDKQFILVEKTAEKTVEETAGKTAEKPVENNVEK